MKTTKNKSITSQQLKALHATFHRIGMDDDARHGCIYEFTSGRTASSRELTMHEARQLLERLNPPDEKTRAMQLAEAKSVFRDIYRLSFMIPQLNQGFTSDNEDEYRMNVAKLNMWARKYSKARKDVTTMKLWELQDTKKQLEAWMRREEKKQKNEIKQAVAILTRKADRLSLVQAEVLQGSMTEQQVFQKYVMEVAEENRDEEMFFAARDAARFSAGHIGLEELIPDVQNMTAADFAAIGTLGVVDEEGDTIMLSRKEFNRLLARIERLEQWTGLRRKAAPGDCTPLPLPEDADMDDMMKQNEACRYLSCGKNTIKGYASRGLVHSYRKGKFTYYSRRELDKKIRKLRDTL